MRRIDYYVASSLNGYIEGKNADISGFVAKGDGVSQYLADLAGYDAVIMGRKTYEFGYKFGLKPGALAYPHMEHYIVSSTLSFANQDDKLHVIDGNIENIRAIKNSPGAPIYLCGGSQTASWLLRNNLIDRLKLKINPLMMNEGTPIFAHLVDRLYFKLVDSQQYNDGLIIATYDVATN